MIVKFQTDLEFEKKKIMKIASFAKAIKRPLNQRLGDQSRRHKVHFELYIRVPTYEIIFYTKYNVEFQREILYVFSIVNNFTSKTLRTIKLYLSKSVSRSYKTFRPRQKRRDNTTCLLSLLQVGCIIVVDFLFEEPARNLDDARKKKKNKKVRRGNSNRPPSPSKAQTTSQKFRARQVVYPRRSRAPVCPPAAYNTCLWIDKRPLSSCDIRRSFGSDASEASDAFIGFTSRSL